MKPKAKTSTTVCVARPAKGERRAFASLDVRPIGGNMEDQDNAIEDTAASEVAWFAVKVAEVGLAVSYALGPAVTIAFLAGWWLGVRTCVSRRSTCGGYGCQRRRASPPPWARRSRRLSAFATSRTWTT